MSTGICCPKEAQGWYWYDPSTPAHDEFTQKVSDNLVSETREWNGNQVKVWLREIVALDAGELADKLAALKSSLIIYTKAEAKRRIIVLLPMSEGAEYRDVEANLLARARELDDIRTFCMEECMTDSQLTYSDPLTALERQELADKEPIWSGTGGIKAIRAASDLIEAEISAETVTTEAEIDNHILWP